MAADPKLQKVLQFYFPELFNHFRSVAEHRLAPAHFNVIKKILWPYSQTGEKLDYLERLRGIQVLSPMNDLLSQTLARVTSGEAKLSTLLSGIEVDSEKLVQTFEKIFRSVSPSRLHSELEPLGIRVDTETAGTASHNVEPRSIASVKPTPTVSAQSAIHSASDDFKRVGDFIAFFSERRARKKTSKTPVDEASSLGTIDDETLKDFTEESTSLLTGYFQAVTRLRSTGDDRSSLNEIRMVMKAIGTAAKLLQIDRLAKACNRVAEFIASVGKDSPLSESALQSLDSLGKTILDFVNNKPVSMTALDTEVARLSTRDEIPQQAKSLHEKTAQELKKTTPAKKTSASVENHHWIEELQAVLDTNYPQNPLVVSVAPTPHRETPVDPKTILEPPAKKAPVESPKPIRMESHETKKPAASDKNRDAISAKPLADSALLNLMASNEIDADLDKMALPTFMEKLAVEPKNLSGTRKRVRRVKKVKKSRSLTPTKDTPAETIEGQYIIREINFNNVDPEILEIFEQESRDYLKSFSSTLEKLSKSGSFESAVKELERTSHTLKSSARMLGFDRISGLAACLEIIAERFFEDEIKIDAGLVTLLGEMIQALGVLFNQKPVVADTLIAQIRGLEERLGTPNILTRNLLPSEAKDTAAIQSPVEEKPATDYFTTTGVDLEIIQIFKEESSTYLLRMSAALDKLHADSASLAAVKDIEKSSHSLRNSAKMLGFDKISRLARVIETIAEKTHRGTVPLTSDVVAAFDTSCQLLKSLAEGTDVDIDKIVRQLDTFSAAVSEKVPAAQEITGSAVSSALHQVIPQKAARKKKVKKKSKLKFADVEVQSDPILKRLAAEAEPLLEEMASSAPK